MLKHFLINYISNGILMKRNLDWHRKVLVLSFPLALFGMVIFGEYIVFRLKRNL